MALPVHRLPGSPATPAGLRAALAAFLLSACAAGAVSAAPPSKPNILFLVTDDQRADTIGALGNPAIRTPNLDALAQSGFVFRNAYCLGSNQPAVCLPSRNMYLSGRAYFRWTGPQAPADGPSFPNALRAAGYETYHHGKRGNSAQAIQATFEHNFYLDEGAARLSGEPGREIVDRALAFLAGRDAARPFFMYLGFEAPHDPRVAAAAYRALYRPADLPLPRNFLPVHPFDNGEMTIRDERLAPWPRAEDEIRRQLHDYYAVISGLDGHLGRLLAALGERGLRENTIVVFTSDHGLALGSHGLMGKQSLYEDAMKAPLIVAGPGIPQGESAALAYLMDVFPTACELAGIGVPSGLDGRSLAPVIRGRAASVRDAVFLAYRDVQRAVRDGRWKLIRYPKINRSQLFDLEADPHETTDLSASPEHAGKAAELLARLAALQREYGDTLPLSSDTPAPAEFDYRNVPPAGGAKGEPARSGAAAPSRTVVENATPLPRPAPGSLGTMGYPATKDEEAHLAKLPENERVTGSMVSDEPYAITGKVGRNVGWFGIVRRIEEDPVKSETRLRVEMKYFDGLTDTHILALSFNGAGDFTCRLSGTGLGLKHLSLVKVYGAVEREEKGLPSVVAEYVRQWDWGLFTFLDAYGRQTGSEEWRKLNQVPLDDIYDPFPGRAYYVERLGPRDRSTPEAK